MKRLKAAIILDNLKLTEWQKNALDEASDLLDIKIVLNCKNTKTKKKIVKNFLYYAINNFSLKNRLTKYSKYILLEEEIIDFNSIYNGNWQSLPSEITDNLKEKNIDIVIKFGMSLLKIDDDLSHIPILSFHHGNPSKFRGRPAGFYELLYDEEKTGLIVQRLNNNLDAGEILAFAESKLIHYSYKKTAEEFYRQSRPLLRKAIINYNCGKSVAVNTDGKNYTLPRNRTVIRFSTILFKRRFKHLIYGAMFEKKWKVGTIKFKPNLRGSNVINSVEINDIPIKSNYVFYADPFFSLDGSKVRLEALDKKSGLGDILEIELENPATPKVLLTGKHYSFPFSFLFNNKEYLLPEVGTHSSQYFFSLDDLKKEKIQLKGLENKRLVDATLLSHNDVWYVFFGEEDSAHSMLNLWVSHSLTSDFKKHPVSPICISPSSARMAGRILCNEEGIFRFGQNNNRGYGSSIVISEIINLSPDLYDEEVCGSIRINNCLGPHSIDFNKDQGMAVIDYYIDKFSPLAGIRRLKAMASKS